MYSEDRKGTERAESEFVPDYKEGNNIQDARARNQSVTQPVVTGMAAKVASESQTTSAGVQRNPERKRVAPVCYDPEIPGRAGQKIRAPRNQGNERVKENWNPNIRDEFVGEQIVEEDLRETKPNKREETSPTSAELEGGSWADNKQDKWDPLDRSDHRQITTLVKELDVNEAIANGYQSDKDYARIDVPMRPRHHGWGMAHKDITDITRALDSVTPRIQEDIRIYEGNMRVLRIIQEVDSETVWAAETITGTQIPVGTDWRRFPGTINGIRNPTG
ncbi:hypothetical protein RhiTH_011749 [Rhizoctonia solani]